ncbi:MAG TPA: CHAT domain-containing protein [Pseudolysinimonas sp.]|nr:CHAT domain-containing protein [Pseudolysinimonas sp.]
MSRRTLFVAGVDRDRSYYFWHWIAPEVSARQAFTVEREVLDPLLARVSDALPTARPGERDEQVVERVLTRGALVDLAAERKLTRDLAAAFLPGDLASEIARGFVDNGEQPILLRLMPSALAAQIPWELLPVEVTGADGTTRTRRLIELADIAYDVPAGIHVGRSKTPEPWAGPASRALYIVDPDTRVYGPVLSDEALASLAERIADKGVTASVAGGEFTRADLHKALTSARSHPGRLMFVGHVVSSTENPSATSMMLSDAPTMYGAAETITRGVKSNRPLSALDLFEGTANSSLRLPEVVRSFGKSGRIEWPGGDDTPTAGAEIWPMPTRVALIACNSGSDLRNPEPFGLALALINAGAGFVSATKWTLPTDYAFHLFAKTTANPLVDLTIAVDDAHSATDPLVELAAWQRGRLAEWEAGGDVAASPILWSSLSNYLGDEREVSAA